MSESKVQTTLRIPEDKARYIKAKAEGIGIPTNAFLLILIDQGLTLYESEIIQLVESPSQFHRVPSQNPLSSVS